MIVLKYRSACVSSMHG